MQHGGQQQQRRQAAGGDGEDEDGGGGGGGARGMVQVATVDSFQVRPWHGLSSRAEPKDWCPARPSCPWQHAT